MRRLSTTSSAVGCTTLPHTYSDHLSCVGQRRTVASLQRTSSAFSILRGATQPSRTFPGLSLLGLSSTPTALHRRTASPHHHAPALAPASLGLECCPFACCVSAPSPSAPNAASVWRLGVGAVLGHQPPARALTCRPSACVCWRACVCVRVDADQQQASGEMAPGADQQLASGEMTRGVLLARRTRYKTPTSWPLFPSSPQYRSSTHTRSPLSATRPSVVQEVKVLADIRRLTLSLGPTTTTQRH
jgi:hypothetical protein